MRFGRSWCSGREGGGGRRRVALIAVAWAVLAAGMVGATVGGVWWDRHQATVAAAGLGATAANVTRTVEASLERDLDFGAAFGAIVATWPRLTNERLASWAQAAQVRRRFGGAGGFYFVVPVKGSGLAAFVSSVRSDPPAGIGGAPYVVYPPGRRSRYCLIRYGVQYRRTSLPVGIDLCAASPAPLEGVARSGRTDLATVPVVLSAGAIPAALAAPFRRSYRGTFVTIDAVYGGGRVPAAQAGRLADLRGWVLGTFSTRSLLDRSLASENEAQVTLRFRQGSGPWHVVSSAGRVRVAAVRARRVVRPRQLDDVELEVSLRRPASSSPFVSGLVVGGAGWLVVGAVLGLLVFLAGSRRRALRRVAFQVGELRHQALYDPLTGLPNRTLLFAEADRLLGRARRRATGVVAIFLDLDNFKDLNETFGHGAGDRLLRAVAGRLRGAVRAGDTVGRLGGDEFLVLAELDGSETSPERLAERLRGALAAPFPVGAADGAPVRVQASMGAVCGLRDRADELVADADVALYAAKSAGKGRMVVFAPAMRAAIENRVALEVDLQRAVAERQLVVLYQPIVDLTSGETVGAEALVRWRHPVRGLLVPDAFVPLAEATGAIVEVGRFVLDEACRQAAAWRAEGRELAVAVNVSAVQLERDDVAGAVEEALARHGLPGRLLTIELTETALMQDTERAVGVLSACKHRGVGLAVDDFGTGYSSLAYLRRFPIDTLKIDRTFVAHLGEQGEQGEHVAEGPLVHTVVELGRSLGIETVAEGIETPAQLEWLRREGCRWGQGFLFGRPMPPGELAGPVGPTPSAAVGPAVVGR